METTSPPFFIFASTGLAMKNPDHQIRSDYTRLLPFLLLAALLFSIYSNSLNASWHMDDKPNILNNKGLHIHDIMPESLWQTFFANQGKAPKLYRPLPCLTLALNWYMGGDNPLGYHIVNIGLHITIAWALYLVMLRLLALLHLKRQWCFTSAGIHDIALLAALLWAINPIQTQAVTYIIQRMAEMATLFYVLGMLYFLKARTADDLRARWCYGLCCAFWFVCGIGSKENAVLLPFSILLMEWIFFRGGRLDFLRRPKAWLIAVFIVIAGLSMVFLLTNGKFLHPHQWYASWLRPFTPEERLMTQPRVVLNYLSQIFYPLPSRLSIAHDVTVFTSLMNPWTTLPAIFIIFSMNLWAIIFACRWPLVSFAVLFFFLNHLVESSIVPLELVFEHRNYLPSLFLFLPVASGLQWILIRLRRDNRFLHAFVSCALIMMLVGLGLGTYTRNMAWASVRSLWIDAVQKAPLNPRPQVYLAQELAWGSNPSHEDYRHALSIYQHCFDFYPTRVTARANILGDMGIIYFKMGENEKAINIFTQALSLDPSFRKARFDMIQAFVIAGRFEEAELHAKFLIDKRPHRQKYLNLMGFILLWQDKPEQALKYFQRALANGPATNSLMLNTGVALSRLNHWENGRWFLQMSARQSPDDIFPLLELIENRVLAGDPDDALVYARRVLYKFSTTHIAERLKIAEQDFRSAPLRPELVAPLLKDALQTSVNELFMPTY